MIHDADLAPDVATHHRRLNADEFASMYVVGDVHGCISELRTLWTRLELNDSDLVVFVGDLIRKGPESAAVVEFVEERERAMSVRGNMEQNLLRRDWPTELPASIRDVLESFPLVISWNDTVVVHGGVFPNKPLSAHTPTDLVELRSLSPENGYDGPFWFEQYCGPPRVMFGHTVCREPVVSDWTIGVDTGCVHGGKLTAYNVTEDEFVSVPAARSYERRSGDIILDPQSL
jgi:serine/threonine protein phosphatase 1